MTLSLRSRRTALLIACSLGLVATASAQTAERAEPQLAQAKAAPEGFKLLAAHVAKLRATLAQVAEPEEFLPLRIILGEEPRSGPRGVEELKRGHGVRRGAALVECLQARPGVTDELPLYFFGQSDNS